MLGLKLIKFHGQVTRVQLIYMCCHGRIRHCVIIHITLGSVMASPIASHNHAGVYVLLNIPKHYEPHAVSSDMPEIPPHVIIIDLSIHAIILTSRQFPHAHLHLDNRSYNAAVGREHNSKFIKENVCILNEVPIHYFMCPVSCKVSVNLAPAAMYKPWRIFGVLLIMAIFIAVAQHVILRL